MPEAYIVEALRTAGGRRNGALRDWHPVDLGAAVIDALLGKTGIDPSAVEDVIVGCVSQVGEQSFHVGRSMVLASTLPQSVPAVTIDRQCGSSQQALHFAAQAVMSGTQDVVLAAGVEHMTRVPMGSPTILAMQAGVGKGPWSAALLEKFGVTEFSQFTGAQMIADQYGFTREQLDAFALASHRKAAAATAAGAFEREIVPLTVIDADGNETLHTRDEGIRADASMEGLAGLKTLKPGKECRSPRRRWWCRVRSAGGAAAAPAPASALSASGKHNPAARSRPGRRRRGGASRYAHRRCPK